MGASGMATVYEEEDEIVPLFDQGRQKTISSVGGHVGLKLPTSKEEREKAEKEAKKEKRKRLATKLRRWIYIAKWTLICVAIFFLLIDPTGHIHPFLHRYRRMIPGALMGATTLSF